MSQPEHAASPATPEPHPGPALAPAQATAQAAAQAAAQATAQAPAPPLDAPVQHWLGGRDVARARERRRLRRIALIGVAGAMIDVVLWWRIINGHPLGWPSLPDIDPLYLMSGLFFVVLIVVMLGTTVVAGRSPHVTFRPEQIDVRISDVKGIGPVTEEVRRTLDLFLAGATFRTTMGGTPRRGLLFEGAPGTGKTHLAKAMAAEAGVPFLFVSGTAFQSMYYGATARKIRSYFTALRKAARREGGAIAFIEEIDAIATVRGGMSGMSGMSGWARLSGMAGCGGLEGLPMLGPGRGVEINHNVVSEGVGGVVNELLVQMQSFDMPTGWQRAQSKATDAINLLLPAHRQIPRPRLKPVDVLVIAATNRASSLDPALLRPGRFDRRLTFELPDQAGRRELIDHFLARKSHEDDLASDDRRDALAGVTQGMSPVEIENLFDEALVYAVRRGAGEMSWADVEQARMLTQIGLGQPVSYTDHERELIATHEAGHAVMAHLVAPHRRLEILTIIKRAGSLGLLAHGDRADVYTRSRRELEGLIQIAFGGQVAEQIFFGDISTGPSGDLAYATTVAAQMVGASGMDDTLLSFAAGRGGALGGDLTSTVLGDAQARAMVEALLARQQQRAHELISANQHLVIALRDALVERHELIGEQITDVLMSAGPAA